MVQRFWLVVFVIFAGCFSPEFRDGQIQCGPNEACPPGLDCVSGLCRRAGFTDDASVDFTLTVSTTGGNGTGTVTSLPVGIDCGADCTEDYLSGSMITLTPNAGVNSTFVGWSGACSGNGTCTVTLNADATVTANFALEYSLVVALAGNGSGFVTSSPSGISCGSDCSEAYDPSTMVTLTGLPVSGSTFDGWSGSGAANCTSNAPCVVTLDAAKMVTATFSLQKHALTIVSSGNGTGVVSSSPTGVDCGLDCNEAYDYNSMVTLTAVPDTGSTFAGWSGGNCTGTGTCIVTMTQATQITASWTLTQHAITVTKAGNGATTGTVTSSPGGIDCGSTCMASFDYNTTVTLSAVPNTGTVFSGWNGAGCTGTGSCIVTTTAAASVTATFTLTTPTLTAAKDGNGAGTVTSTNPSGIDCGNDCSEAVNYGTTVTLTAVPATGSTFTTWAGGTCTGNGTCMQNVTGATTITATFTLTTHTLTVMTTGAGTVTGSGISCPGGAGACDETFNYGTQVTLTASPSAGSTFTAWGGGVCSGTGSCVVTMNQAATVTATFTLTTHQLTVSKTGNGAGTITAANMAEIDCGTDCTEVYGFGTNVSLTATPATGSSFTGWTNGPCSTTTTNPCPVTISDATSAIANFQLDSFNLNVTIPTGGTNGTGTVTANIGTINCPGDCSDPYNYGTVVTLTANPAGGSSFTSWSGAGCSGNGSCIVTVDAVKDVIATFTLGSAAVTVSTSGGNGTGTVTSVPSGIMCGLDCSEDFTNGTNVTLTATPATGSTFTSWSGGTCTGASTCMFTTTGTPVTAIASFTLDIHTLTVATNGANGTGNVVANTGTINCGNGGSDCNDPYNYGTSVTLTATPATGSSFTGWSGGGCSGTGTCVVPVTMATTVTASFTLNQHRVVVSKISNGSGGVVANVGALTCGGDCDEIYNYGTSVTLTATAATGSTFTGWTGACTGSPSLTCVLNVDDDKDVIASFTLTTHLLTTVISGPNGSGTIDMTQPSALIACPGDCTETLNYGTDITLKASANTGFTFDSWSGGGCSGTGNCDTTITAPTTVTATFSVATFALTVNLAGNGAGTVNSSPAGITCSGGVTDCSETYPYNQSVQLTPTPSTGSVFTSWGAGQCTGGTTAVPCVVSMTQARNVTATFTLTTHLLTVTKQGAGTGLISSSPAGISCTGGVSDCTELYNYGQVVNLTATPDAGMTFTAWSGGVCSGNTTCQVTMTQARGVTAQFAIIPPNYVFITSTNQTGNLGGLTGADAICAARATAGGLTGTFSAWLSTSTVNAISRLGSATGWVRPDGRPVFNTQTDLITGRFSYPISLDEFGVRIPDQVHIETATTSNGLYSTAGGSWTNCSDWTSAASATVYIGWPSSATYKWTQYAGGNCSNTALKIICFGTDNQAVAKPPVVAVRRAFTTSATWAPNQGIASADALCASEAAGASLSGTFSALLATQGASAIARFKTGSGFLPWANVNDAQLASTSAALSATTPAMSAFDAPPNLDADGKTWLTGFFWTGAPDLVTAGTATTTCNNWASNTSSSFAYMGNGGQAGFSDGWKWGNQTWSCNATRRLVCLEE